MNESDDEARAARLLQLARQYQRRSEELEIMASELLEGSE
jgi:hypothetical protein